MKWSEILFALRHLLNLSALLPKGDRRSIVYDEWISCQGLNPQEARIQLEQNRKAFGKYKLEFGKTETSYLALPQCALFIREKLYHISVMYKDAPDGPFQVASKIAARGAVPKTRMQKYGLEEFVRMAQLNLTRRGAKPKKVRKIISLRSRNFNLFQLKSKRHESFVFSRKRHLTSDGNSRPLNFYRNAKLDRIDARKRRQITPN